MGGGHRWCCYDRPCACDVKANEFRGNLRTADKGAALLLEQPVGRHRLEIERVLGNYRLDDVQDEARPIRHYRRDVDLCDDLKRGETAGRHSYLFDALGGNVLSYVTVRRELLVQCALGAVAWCVEGAQKRHPWNRVGIQVVWQIGGTGQPEHCRIIAPERALQSATMIVQCPLVHGAALPMIRE